MKHLCLLFILTVVSVELSARENPFEPTDTYIDKQEEYFKQIEAKKLAKQKKIEEDRLQEEMLLQREKELAQIELEKQQELERIKQIQKEKEALEKQKIKEMKNYKALPFVTIQTFDKELLIHVDTKFQLINQDILKKQNKFLFDFSGNTSFYTIRKNLEHQHFKAYAIGTHRKEGYFRVVIDLSDKAINYKEHIDTKKGTISIKYKN
jgi:hypothetical protein